MRKNRVTIYWVVTDESQSESCLVVSDSLWLHGILQARILEWVAFPFYRWSSQPRNQTQVSHTAGRFFINWAIREALLLMTDAYFLINPTGGPHSQCVNHNMQSLWPWGQERGCLHHNPPWQPQRHTDRHRFPVFWTSISLLTVLANCYYFLSFNFINVFLWLPSPNSIAL